MNTPAQQPRDFAGLFGSGRPEDWEGFDETLERWRNEGREMSDRPTPDTDEAAFGTGRVSADFARRLERERNEARMQHRTTELLGMALVKTIDELKAEKAAIFAQLISLQAGSRRATLDEIAESVREKYDPEYEREGMENE